MALLDTLLIQLGVDATDLDREVQRINDGLSQVSTNAMALGKTLGGALAVGPALAPAVAAVGGLSAAFVSAGASIGAFKAAVGPQLADVAEAADLFTAAQEAQAAGGEKAAAAQKAYKDALSQLPPATQATAKEFIGLKSDFAAWSDQLSATTMPIFTQGLKTLRGLLPTLTPFVKDAAKSIGAFTEGLAKDLKSEGFKQFMGDLRASAKKTLPDMLNTFKNIAVGFGGIIQAFLPMSSKISGGLESMTAKFAAWGQGLSGSPAFSAFQKLAAAGGGALGQLGAALIEILASLAPVLGATTKLATVFAQLVAAIPVDVLATFGKLLIAAKAATIAYAVVTRTIAIATGLWSAAQGILNTVMLLNPVGLIIAAIVALIAIIVLIVGKTEFFKNVWNTVWNAVKTAFFAVWNAIKTFIMTIFNFLKNLFMNFTGPGLIIKHWDTIKRVTIAAFMAVWNFIKKVFNFLKNLFMNFTGPGLVIKHWNKIKTFTISVFNTVKNFVLSVFNAIKNFITSRLSAAKNAAVNAFNRIKNFVRSAINSARRAVTSAVGKIASTIRGIKGKVMGALRGAGRWLLNAGKNIIRGLINGIKSMLSSVKNAVGNVVGAARDFLPFSPAKEGPFSGAGAPELSGKAISENLAKGIMSGMSAVDNAASAMMHPLDAERAAVRRALARRVGGGVAPGISGAAGRIVIDVEGADEGMKQLIRRIMRTSNLVVN